MSNRDDKEITSAVVEMVRNLMEPARTPYDFQALTLTDAIDRALDADVDFRFSNNGNTWERTTGNKWGLTAADIRAALARSQAASALGAAGGSVKSEAKAASSKANGSKGGRPRKQPK